MISQCLADVRTLLNHFAGDDRVNVERCAVTGPSMGGYASFLIFADAAYAGSRAHDRHSYLYAALD